MKKILFIFLLFQFLFSNLYSKDYVPQKNFIVICNGDLKIGLAQSFSKKFTDEYKFILNTSQYNKEMNKTLSDKTGKKYRNYLLNNPIANIQLINSTSPAKRTLNLHQDHIVNRSLSLDDPDHKLINDNVKLYKLLYPNAFKKIYYAELDYRNNILDFRYKYLEYDMKTGIPYLQENISSISLNTGLYISNLTHKHTEGKLKGTTFKFRYEGVCDVNSVNFFIANLKKESEGSFSYNYLFFLLIIIGITIFVYKQGPKKKRKIK